MISAAGILFAQSTLLQITRALNEVQHGTFVDLSQLSIKSMVDYTKVYRHFMDILAKLEKEHPDIWNIFISQVNMT